jgi:hypothetical protein
MFGFELTLALGIAAGAPVAPQPVVVPPAIRAQNATIELSGIVWAAALDRYLVVSDDAGAAGDGHRPWVFAMSRAGALDDTPLTIAGLESLSDPEAICAGPDGTFFLATSHSPNTKGKTSKPRRMILHLRLEGRSLVVLGKGDLTTARDAGGGSILAIAGLDPEGRLDVEAITFQAGALLVGLKSPLSAKGAAVILRLASPVAALRAGSIPAGALTRLREVPLQVVRDGKPVDQGIADLAALPDGSLVLAANSPKGSDKDGGGAVYWLKAGASVPVLLRRFPGLKPEGVTLGADGKELIIVFDNDKEPPLWARLPLPR